MGNSQVSKSSLSPREERENNSIWSNTEEWVGMASKSLLNVQQCVEGLNNINSQQKLSHDIEKLNLKLIKNSRIKSIRDLLEIIIFCHNTVCMISLTL